MKTNDEILKIWSKVKKVLDDEDLTVFECTAILIALKDYLSFKSFNSVHGGINE